MFSSSTSAIFRFIGWSFLPSILASGAIDIYHRVLSPGIAPPRQGTLVYASQYRIAFTVLATVYFLYTLVAAVTSLQPNYYHILGVGQRADEQALKLAFRQFARRNHPDRPGVGADGADRFRDVRNAYEMLKNPVKRFAYERFGPEVISWKDCTTPMEYIVRGVSASSGFPIGTAAVLCLMSLLGQSPSSSFVSICIQISQRLSTPSCCYSGDTSCSRLSFLVKLILFYHQLTLCRRKKFRTHTLFPCCPHSSRISKSSSSIKLSFPFLYALPNSVPFFSRMSSKTIRRFSKQFLKSCSESPG